MNKKIAVIPGDGIGVEVIPEAVRCLDRVAELFGHSFTYEHFLVGGCCIDQCGVPITEETLRGCAACDAILFGAGGGPKWDDLPHELRPERGLGTLRHHFNLFCNIRPAKVFPELMDASPLKRSVLERDGGVDLVLVRDLTGGIYFGEKGVREGKYGTEGYDVECYSKFEVARVARRAFALARSRRGKLTSIDKSNTLAASRIWRETVTEIGEAEFPDVALDHMLVDSAAQTLVCEPSRFDVLVTTSIFGDILSDEAGVLTGSIGMLPSAAMNDKGFGLFEPIHGVGIAITGLGIANPLASIMAAAMLLRDGLGLTEEGAAVDRAVARVLRDGYRTGDIYRGEPGQTLVNTEEMGRRVAERITRE